MDFGSGLSGTNTMTGNFFITMSSVSQYSQNFLKPPEGEVLNFKFLKSISASEDICCSEASTLFKAGGDLEFGKIVNTRLRKWQHCVFYLNASEFSELMKNESQNMLKDNETSGASSTFSCIVPIRSNRS